ncbi:prolyl-tRNA synthetase-like protein [Amylocarpus encephaloides]|uniref:Prolyl-tRNA synthetase-like protein n=1 Tax=Amylocarpus encephaloides TaxID=45428 RepID=A0A9P7YU66_9HELO|nr:prolyl-tRNA synthetase-like protein [Amylocarpus encephaloides]
MRYSPPTSFPCQHQLYMRTYSTRSFSVHNRSSFLPFRWIQSRASHSHLRETDHRARLSKIWVRDGAGGLKEGDDSHSRLITAGFLAQAHSGIYHMLPLGRRVQAKLEALIDRYMSKLGASKVDLSSISSASLWKESGRLDSIGDELFRFKDRKQDDYLLAPTHEEEITTLVSSSGAGSYKHLPIRLYQICKYTSTTFLILYRDELRPRHGLLRSREFIMKDLYTFDQSTSLALATYNEVRRIYARLFDELKLPYLVAEADSGDMGGNLSHEFHFPTSKGEDHIIGCTSCDYVSNEELATNPIAESANIDQITEHQKARARNTVVKCWSGISKDRSTLVNVWYGCTATEEGHEGEAREVNARAVKSVFPDLDSSVENAEEFFTTKHAYLVDRVKRGPRKRKPRIIHILDSTAPEESKGHIEARHGKWITESKGLRDSMGDLPEIISHELTSMKPLNLLRTRSGDACPRCHTGTVKVQKAIELGHTFHLGTRYSKPMKASFAINPKVVEENRSDFEIQDTVSENRMNALYQMGCHGIGVSRMIGAVVDTLADEKGLNWPRVMAPYEVVVVAVGDAQDHMAGVYDKLSVSSESAPALDVVLDDRADRRMGWKMRDADTVGYPVIVLLGRRWGEERMCEVQCRRLKIKEDVHVENLQGFVRDLLDQL